MLNKIHFSCFMCVVCIFVIVFGFFGCNKSKECDGKEASGGQKEDSELFKHYGKKDKPNQNGWRSVSDNLITQINSEYENKGVKIDKLERNDSNGTCVRVSLLARPNLSVQKQLLDGMILLYENYPKQDSYIIKISNTDEEIMVRWKDLVELRNKGYHFGVNSQEARQYWEEYDSPPKEESSNAQTTAIQ